MNETQYFALNNTLLKVNELQQQANINQKVLNQITFISIFIMFLFFFRILLIKVIFPMAKFKPEIEDTITGSIEVSIVSVGLVQVALCLIYL